MAYLGTGNLIEDALEPAKNWFEQLYSQFAKEFVTFLITVVVLCVFLLLVAIISKGKIIKIRKVPKILLNCVFGYLLMFVIGAVGGFFTGGAWTFAPKAWYSWVIIGVFGLLGVIFLIVSVFVWPELFITTIGTAG